MSATTRMVLDSVRTLGIWGVSLAVGWQTFQYLQLLGFLILVTGMCVYNDIVIAPLGRKVADLCRNRYNRLDEETTTTDAQEQEQHQDDNVPEVSA